MRNTIRNTAICLFLAVVLPVGLSVEGCSSSKTSDATPKKKGPNLTAGSAVAVGQTTGSAASSAKSKGQDKGSAYESVDCTAADEGVGWCDDDATLIFCSGGHFYALDCGEVGDDVCAEDTNLGTVDCYPIDEVE